MNRKSTGLLPCQALLTLAILLSACGVGAPGGKGEPAAPISQPSAADSAAKPTAESLAFPMVGDGCPAYPSDFVPVTGTAVYQPPDLAEPPPRQWFTDPTFGTCLVRVTDRRADLPADDPSGGLKNEYSRVQSFNADDSLILVRSTEANWYLYDAHSLQPLGRVPIEVEPRWDAVDPDLLFYSDGTRLMQYDVGSGQASLVHEFAADFPGQALSAVWTRYEGNPSRDGRFWGLMAEDEEWQTVAYLVYDRQTDQIAARRDLRGWSAQEREIDAVTISPLGTYFLAYTDRHCEAGLGSDAEPCGLMVYDHNLQNGRSLVRIIGHSDLALDAGGREVLVFQDVDADTIALLDLASGQVTALYPIDFSHTAIGLHFSGQSFDAPGWVLVSTHDGDRASHTWLDDQVFALELEPNGRVVHLAHTHSLVDENQEHDYWAEPQASVNRDFSRVLFTTNWNRSGTDQVEMFMVQLPPDEGRSRP